MIGGNGSYVEHRGEVILHRLITPEPAHGDAVGAVFKHRDVDLGGPKGNRIFYIRPQVWEPQTVREAFPDMVFGGEQKASYSRNPRVPNSPSVSNAW